MIAGAKCAQTGIADPGRRVCPALWSYITGCGYRIPGIHGDLTGQLFLKACDPYRSDRFRTIATWCSAEAGKVYESNSVMLLAALRSIGMEAQAVHHVPDDPQATLALLDRLSTECDYILATGGVSVGDYDCRTDETPSCVSKHLPQGETKTGKAFAVSDNFIVRWCLVCLEIPPACSTCFYAYVMPSLLKASGISHSNHYNKARLSEDLQKKPGLTVFYKAVLQDDVVRILPQQSPISSAVMPWPTVWWWFRKKILCFTPAAKFPVCSFL